MGEGEENKISRPLNEYKEHGVIPWSAEHLGWLTAASEAILWLSIFSQTIKATKMLIPAHLFFGFTEPGYHIIL